MIFYGQVSLDELLAAMAPEGEEIPEDAKEDIEKWSTKTKDIFPTCDKNGDGLLDKEELKGLRWSSFRGCKVSQRTEGRMLNTS